MRDEIRPQWELAGLAGQQHGVVSHLQLEELGYSPASIGRAVRGGRLHLLYRGAYAVGHPAVSRHGRCLAAVLASGAGAMLSHESAAWLWGLLAWWQGDPDVTVPTRGHSKAGAGIHHSTILRDADRAIVDGVPVTAVARTLLDLAARRSPRRLTGAVDRAERLNLLDLGQIDELLGRSGGHRGKRKLEKELEIYRDPAVSRARSELLFLDLVKKAGLPRPAINTFVAGHEIDAYWEKERFAIEVDGWETHRTRRAFETDPVRLEELKLAGIDAIRITARRIEQEPKAVGASLQRLLDMRRNDLRAAQKVHSGRS